MKNNLFCILYLAIVLITILASVIFSILKLIALIKYIF